MAIQKNIHNKTLMLESRHVYNDFLQPTDIPGK